VGYRRTTLTDIKNGRGIATGTESWRSVVIAVRTLERARGVVGPGSAGFVGTPDDYFERGLGSEARRKSNGNRTKAAELLKVEVLYLDIYSENASFDHSDVARFRKNSFMSSVASGRAKW